MDDRDYICSMPKDSGMRTCDTLPYSTAEDGETCTGNITSIFFNNNNSSSCVNWNQYYTDCRAGDKNPFQGAISFDHVGLAFIAVYQVRHNQNFFFLNYIFKLSNNYV